MIKKSVLFASALALGAFSATAALAADEAVPATETSGGNAVAESDNAVSFSYGPFYALAEDDYGVSGSSIDIYGLTFLLNYEVRKPIAPCTVELGVFATFGLGDDDFSVSGVDCSADQYDFMLGVRFGIRIPFTEKFSVGLGMLSGFDLRRCELDIDDDSLGDTQLGSVSGVYLEGTLRARDNWTLVINYSRLVTDVDFDGDLDGLDGNMTYHMISVGCRYTW